MEAILMGLNSILNLQCMLLITGGVALGICFGAVPGLSATMAVALCLPITFGMDLVPSMCLLVGLYMGGISGGLISAILLKIPGTASSVATTFDGYPMAARGEAGKALCVGILASFCGGLVSFIILFFLAPAIAQIAINFTPYDYFAVVLFSLTMITTLSGKNLKKGLLAGCMGVVFSFVGSDPIDAYPRYTLGIHALDGGLATLPVVVGLFAVAEILDAAREAYAASRNPVAVQYEPSGFRIPFSELKGQGINFIRSCLIGTGIGVLPGIGGGVSNLISYTVSKLQSKHPERYGTGCVDGIIASETANNATIGGALVPLLALGIPGDSITAMLISGFLIQGIAPGPLLFIQQRGLVYSIFGSLIIANIAMLILMFLLMRVFVRVLSVPKPILLPLVMVVCMIGAYGSNNRVFDIYVVVLFGIIGALLKYFDYPVAPVVMGLILGPTLEQKFRRGMMYSQGSLLPFFQQPIAVVFLILTAISILLTIRNRRADL